MKTYGGMDVQIQVFLISALGGGEWSPSRSSRFIYKERVPGTHWIGGWVGPRTGLDTAEKILHPTGTRTPTPSVVQLVASRYTDYAIPALNKSDGASIKKHLYTG
jgi:hypothetical protein